jgi:hypothetical protein
MTLRQLALIKRWHVQHRHRHPVEFQAWDAVLTAWMLGLIGAPAALILHAPGSMLGCIFLAFLPSLYVGCRESLHRHRWLRCDWLDSLHAAQRAETH